MDRITKIVNLIDGTDDVVVKEILRRKLTNLVDNPDRNAVQDQIEWMIKVHSDSPELVHDLRQLKSLIDEL